MPAAGLALIAPDRTASSRTPRSTLRTFAIVPGPALDELRPVRKRSTSAWSIDVTGRGPKYGRACTRRRASYESIVFGLM